MSAINTNAILCNRCEIAEPSPYSYGPAVKKNLTATPNFTYTVNIGMWILGDQITFCARSTFT